MTAAQQTVATQDEGPGDDRWRAALRRIVSGSWAVSLGAIVLAVVVGSVMIAVFDPGVRAVSGYFFARPQDTLAAIGHAVGGAYSALFRGAVWDYSVLHKQGFGAAIRPFTNSLTQATPLITAGLVEDILDDVMAELPAFDGHRYDDAARVFLGVALDPDFQPFLTTGAYLDYLVDDTKPRRMLASA